MKFTEFASYIRYKTRTDSTTFTDANILLLANIHKNDMAVRILDANENYFGLPMTTGLVASQREYPLDPTVAGQLKFIEAKLDGTNWKRLYETDFNFETFTTDEAAITSAFTGRQPAFAFFRNSIWILSDSAIATVTSGLKIWAYIFPADFTDLTANTEMALAPSTTTHGWPKQFQELLARRVIIDYKESREKPIPLTQSERQWENDFLTQMESIMNPNLDREIIATLPQDNGEDY